MENEKIARRTALMAAHGAVAVLLGTKLIEAMPGIDHEYAVATTRMLAGSMLNAGFAYASLVSRKYANRYETASIVGLVAIPLALLAWAYWFTG